MYSHLQRLSLTLNILILTVGFFSIDAAVSQEITTGTRYENRTSLNNASNYKQYCLAVLQGDIKEAYYLGWLRFNGRGIQADDELAVWWFRLAAEQGDPHSQRILDDFLPSVEPKEDAICPLRRKKPNRENIEAWINVLAPSYGLDPNLLFAVVEVESRFNPRASSPKNAQGLMQLLPKTASRFKVKDIWDPIENLKGGMAYLRWLLDYYKGDINLSLAAYNAGEDAVERYGGIPPYQETRDYVRSVNRIYNKYIQ